MQPLVWSAVALLLQLLTTVAAEHTETLHVRSLPHTNKALAHFHFATTETRISQNPLYPTVLRQILTKYDVASVHLSFSVGHYSEGLYGPAHTQDGAGVHAPFGTRLQVAFAGEEATSGPFSERWKGVTSELGGVFSASLNQMDETSIRRIPTGASAAEFGAYDPFAASPTHFLEASLPREELCTENLTPWLKMLPCRAHAGLGMLVDPIKILSGEYAMLSLYAARNASTGDWRIHQHLVTVQSTTTGRGERDAAFSLSSLLMDGSSSTSEINDSIHACPLAVESILTTEDGVSSPITATSLKNALSTTQPLMPTHDPTSSLRPTDVVAVHRFQTGFGQVHGGIAVRLENRHATCAMAVTYNDVAPWYLRLYFHTFQTRIMALSDLSSPLSRTPPQSPSVSLDFVPAELRGRPNQFRVQFVLPPQSALVLSVQFDKAFVRLSEHPPDANRGFDIPSGVATFTPLPLFTTGTSQECHVDHHHHHHRVVYSEPLLVALPTPDFSMPYNVITLTSTVVAFFAGSMLNTLLRKAPRIKRMLADELPKSKTH